jgi:hypothetical protein
MQYFHFWEAYIVSRVNGSWAKLRMERKLRLKLLNIDSFLPDPKHKDPLRKNAEHMEDMAAANKGEKCRIHKGDECFCVLFNLAGEERAVGLKKYVQ